ncbi:MAG: YgfZ/GcvT domain-containing protein [Pyrinomonadaceae bacterium]
MNSVDFQKEYEVIRENGIGFYEQKRGLIAVWGKESVRFLNGLITIDVTKLESGDCVLAAFPNAQGRTLAIVSVLRLDGKFLFETETATHEKVFNNLFRFTFAGDFFVEDLSENYIYFSLFGKGKMPSLENVNGIIDFQNDYFVSKNSVEIFKAKLEDGVEISDELYEVLRIETGIPLYGVEMDETTIVPEIGLPELISYNKGCYIGQEIIARIHFRGHVAKKLTGLIFEDNDAAINPNDEIKSLDGKNAGRITSVTFSPELGKIIALAYVRYDYLAEETELKVGNLSARVKDLPFVE